MTFVTPDGTRTHWIERCVFQLGRLCPDIELTQAYMIATDLWSAHGGTMTPELAARGLAEDASPA